MDVRRHLTEREHGPCMGARNLLEECYPSAAVTVIHEVRPIAGGVRPDVLHAVSPLPRRGRHSAQGRRRLQSPQGSIRAVSLEAMARYQLPRQVLYSRVVGGTILWDVDTQVDFIEPGGKLYFAGAEEARPAMARVVEAAREAGSVHVASCDQHELSDPEISTEPDLES